MSASFRAMTTDVAVIAPSLGPAAEARLARRVEAVFAESDRAYSRFREDSELSRINRGSGPVRVSADLLALICRARSYVARTSGAFDPGVGAAVVAAGYDRSFAPGALDRDAAPTARPTRTSLLDVAIDEGACTVTLPAGAQLDLGGLAKGLTVDRAAALLPDVGAIDAGGDAVLRGEGPDGEGWVVDVEDPNDASRVVLSFRARDRAIATSAANRRRWRVGSIDRHHLIDPRTGEPARSDVAQATAIAASAELADVLAKSVFVLGAREGARLLDREGAAGVLVLASGAIEIVGEIEVLRDA